MCRDKKASSPNHRSRRQRQTEVGDTALAELRVQASEFLAEWRQRRTADEVNLEVAQKPCWSV